MVGQPWARRAGPAFGYQKPMYDQCDQYAPGRPLCQGPSYMQQPYGNGIGYQQPLPGYGDYAQPAVLPQQSAYASYGHDYDMQQRQGNGSRMAMAAAGGLALGAGAVFAADHAGDMLISRKRPWRTWATSRETSSEVPSTEDDQPAKQRL